MEDCTIIYPTKWSGFNAAMHWFRSDFENPSYALADEILTPGFENRQWHWEFTLAGQAFSVGVRHARKKQLERLNNEQR